LFVGNASKKNVVFMNLVCFGFGEVRGFEKLWRGFEKLWRGFEKKLSRF
jgi:hypothetical protein